MRIIAKSGHGRQLTPVTAVRSNHPKDRAVAVTVPHCIGGIAGSESVRVVMHTGVISVSRSGRSIDDPLILPPGVVSGSARINAADRRGGVNVPNVACGGRIRIARRVNGADLEFMAARGEARVILAGIAPTPPAAVQLAFKGGAGFVGAESESGILRVGVRWRARVNGSNRLRCVNAP